MNIFFNIKIINFYKIEHPLPLKIWHFPLIKKFIDHRLRITLLFMDYYRFWKAIFWEFFWKFHFRKFTKLSKKFSPRFLYLRFLPKIENNNPNPFCKSQRKSTKWGRTFSKSPPQPKPAILKSPPDPLSDFFKDRHWFQNPKNHFLSIK